MLSWIPTKLVFAAGLLLTGVFIGWRYEHDKLIEFKAHVEAIGAAQNDKTNRIIQAHEKEKNVFHTIYQRRIDDLNQRLRNTDSGGRQLPPNAQTASGTNGTSSDPVPDAKLTYECSVTTIQLVTLQEWLKRVSTE